jgi:hypothetical protein
MEITVRNFPARIHAAPDEPKSPREGELFGGPAIGASAQLRHFFGNKAKICRFCQTSQLYLEQAAMEADMLSCIAKWQRTGW